MPRSPRRPARAARASASRPAAVDRSSATDCLPAFSRSKNWLGPRRAPSGRCGRLDLDHRGAGAWSREPQSGPAHSEPSSTTVVSVRAGAGRARAQRVDAAPAARRGAAGRLARAPRPEGPAAEPRSTTSPDGRPLDRRARSSATGRRAARRARAMPARAPRRRGARATPRSTRHRRGGGGWRPRRWWYPAGGGPRSRRARPGGPAGRPRAAPPSARAAPRDLRPERGEAGHEAGRRTQRLTDRRVR